MVENVEVERLKGADKPEMVELFIQAFEKHPLIPALGGKPELGRPIMDAFIDCFGRAESSLAYGIRQDDKLICTSITMDAGEEPPKLVLMGFIFTLYQALGRYVVEEFKVIHDKEPEYQERYLELLIFGTLPSCQQQGFGRKMLSFLYDKARDGDYKGVTLMAGRDTPAFQLYSKEGFVVDSEFTVGGEPLCWMRLNF